MSNRRFLSRGLERRFPGVRVTLCENGAEAVAAVTAAMAADDAPDLICMDASMPVMVSAAVRFPLHAGACPSCAASSPC